MAAGDLTTLATLEAALELAAGNPAEALLSRLITAASDLVTRICSVAFVPGDFTETRDGNGGASLIFNNTPVSAVASVTIDGNPILPLSANQRSGYSFNAKRLALTGYRFRKGIANITLAYTAGYATVPPAAEQAVIELVMLRYKERKHFDMRSEAGLQQTTTYFVGDMKPSTLSALNQFRRSTPICP